MSGEDDEERIDPMTADQLRRVVPETFEEGENTS